LLSKISVIICGSRSNGRKTSALAAGFGYAVTDQEHRNAIAAELTERSTLSCRDLFQPSRSGWHVRSQEQINLPTGFAGMPPTQELGHFFRERNSMECPIVEASYGC
jgi:hypothetical protein